MSTECRGWRIIPLVMAALIASSAAETLYLKNGTFLVVDKASEKDGQIEYVLGGTTYTIPRVWVERIAAGRGPAISLGAKVPSSAVPPSSAPAQGTVTVLSGASPAADTTRNKIEIAPPEESAAEKAARAALLDRILTNGRVDEGALAQIERDGNRAQSAAAYLEAGKFALRQDQPENAASYFNRALGYTPDSEALLEWYTIALAQAGKYADAVAPAEKISQLAPNSAGAFRLLGMVYYDADRPDDAIGAWKRALELRPDAFTRELLNRAQREVAVERDYNQLDSSHFTLRYEGQRTSLALQRDLLQVLEEQYRSLVQQLNFVPTENINIILYTQKAFFDITQAPSWAGAVNDGKLRIPIEGVESATPELQHVLKHELSHSFLRLMTRGRCPAWLNEGLAQMLEPMSSAPWGALLAQLYQEKKEAPLKLLEAPFNGLSGRQAQVAYLESLATVEYLRHAHGMDEVQHILHRIAGGETPEEALRAVTRDNYPELQREIAAYLVQNYARQ